ncbi:hypothetical protein PPSIR1_06938 [Plesiocystis pacifica SIR-1]|uniref:SGNH hydrolase-type esterase domain-containing protein n=1 Tax=Plesiocystis pacifica SIR-1 TaxID=391625 RepID=A6G546_9BACT|nr:SGNH/GDSL hydrolase family protein [Plesiocystis pacifica]EDM78958.1 hypothetical protein PPSIR1_06938 [Plesiocystis pacifica SIR-1]
MDDATPSLPRVHDSARTMRTAVFRVTFVLALAVGGCADDSERPPALDDDGLTGTEGADEAGETEASSTTDTSPDPRPDLGASDDSAASESEDESSDTGGEPPPPLSPPLYPGGRVHSPITAATLEALAAIRSAAPAAPEDLFIKVGASSTVNTKTLYCFATEPVDLGDYEAQLGPSLDFFLLGDAGETTPFDRDTLAAEVGKTAGWAIDGDPSPVEAEIAAVHPEGSSLALVHYGANDMQQGLTYASALPGYHANMSDLLDGLIDAGVVPVVFGISRRLDQAPADLWVQSYNAVARGLAQARQVPFVDLREALEPLGGYGLSNDGLHLEGFPGGACLLTPEALEHGYNVRNLLGLEVLARLERALVDEAPSDPDDASVLVGDGSFEDAFAIDALPFADTRDSNDGPGVFLDVYTGCGSSADESGPEHLYRLELDTPTKLRALVLDHSGVDVDVHLLDASASEAGCILRDDRLIETALEPGTYYFSLDTYVNGEGVEQGGEYTFAVLACEANDPDCT